MNEKPQLRIGLIGTVVAALGCFTPVLVILLGVAQLSALVGHLDDVLFPALAFFAALTAFALWRRSRQAAAPDGEENV